MQRPPWGYGGGSRDGGGANPPMQQQQQWSDPRPRQTFERAYDPYEVAEDENEAGYLAAGGNFAHPTTTLGGGSGDALNTTNRHSSAFPAAASFEPPPPPPPPQQERGIVATSELPPHLRAAFPFRYFNLVQSECFDAAFGSPEPLVVVAPTGAGKTGVLDLALARLLLESAGGFGSRSGEEVGGATAHAKALYIAPSRALVQERVADWKRRFGPVGAACAELTGDAGGEGGDEFGAASASNAAALLDAATIICATPEKLDATTRHRGTRAGNTGGGARGGFSRSAAFIGDVGLVLLDEVHLLSEAPRGATLEAVVARLRVLGASLELSGRPLARARFVAVSATMPNPGDVGSWLGGAADGGGARAVVRTFGDEVRPVPLRTLVRAFPDTRTDFLFEKSLNRPLLDVLSEHAAGRPALVFCASRNGASDTAKFVAAAWKAAGRIGNNGAAANAASAAATHFDRRALESLASSLSSRPLAECARFGVGFHHAGLEPRDRALLEAAFAARQLPCLCTTSTLAVGVNLPAYLVVIKGTRRWCSAGEAAASVGVGGAGTSIGGAGGGGGSSTSAAAAATSGTAAAAKTTSASSGFVEYDATTILQMVGRAGRPQFDTTGFAVVMTQSSAAARFLELVRGSKALDSQLEECLPEHLNAEIVLRTVTDVPAAVRWLKATFLWARVRSDPASRGFPRKLAAAGGSGVGGDASAAPSSSPSSSSSSSTLERLATQRYISSTVNALVSQGFATADPADGYSLAPTLAGQLAARHYVRLPTLAAAARAPRHASLPDLLECLCGAAEFSGVALRRSEKKQLAEMNKRAEAEGRPFVVAPESLSAAAAGRSSSSNPKPKKTISTPREKLLVLVSDALGEQPAEALDYSMRSELDGVLKTGRRIAACVATLFASEASSNGGNGGNNNGTSSSSSSSVPFSFNGNARLAATANAHRLARSLRAGCWDGTGAEARQLPGIGRTLSARLAAADLGTMRALLRADGRDVERATGRPFPFGHQLVAEANAMAPISVSVKVTRPELRRGGGGGGGGDGDGSSFARWEFSVTLTRGEDDDDGDDDGDEGDKENENPLPPRHKKSSSSSSSNFYAKLFVGTPENDHLLLCETVSLTTFRSPYSVRLAAPAAAAGRGGRGGSSWALPADAAKPPAVVAAVLHDRVVGLDVVADASSSSHASKHAAPSAAAAAAPPKSRPAPPPSSADAPPAKKAATLAAAAGRQANLFESFKVVPAAIEEQQQQKQKAASVPEGGGEGGSGATGEGKVKEKEKEKGKAAVEVAPAPLPAPAGDNGDDDEFADVFGFL